MTDGRAASVRVYAPGGIGNFGPGLDILGCATEGRGDTITASRSNSVGVRVVASGHPDIPADPTRHAGAVAARAVLDRIGAMDVGVDIHTEKGLPLAGGQGGSAASAVAAAVAVNELFGRRLDVAALLEAALAGESSVAGRHADNVAPALIGGIILVRSMDPIEIVPLRVPDNLRLVLVHPRYRLTTAESRGVLPAMIPRATAIHQMAQVATIVAALDRGDVALLGRAIDDRIAEPARAHLLPGFAAAKRAALGAGAFGCSISGAGPTMFAVTDDEAAGARIVEAACASYEREGIVADGRVARVDLQGARVLS
jgi:homoserine kinase